MPGRAGAGKVQPPDAAAHRQQSGCYAVSNIFATNTRVCTGAWQVRIPDAAAHRQQSGCCVK